MFCLYEREGGCIGKPSGDKDSGEFIGSEEHDVLSIRESDIDNTSGINKDFKDAVSTGRKRAAQLYPITVGQICKWAWHKQCGGGIVPIIGCTGRPASNIHHGPDKSTLNNEPTNISVICSHCHNRWHVANDKYYPLPRPANGEEWLPTLAIEEGLEVHSTTEITKASKVEILANEAIIPEGGKDKL
jgi:hypothetical protein